MAITSTPVGINENLEVDYSLAAESADTGTTRVLRVAPYNIGTFGYKAGVSGTPAIPAGARVTRITCVGGAGGGTITINGGDTITVPVDAGFDEKIEGNLIAPTVVFTGTSSYYVAYWV